MRPPLVALAWLALSRRLARRPGRLPPALERHVRPPTPPRFHPGLCRGAAERMAPRSEPPARVRPGWAAGLRAAAAETEAAGWHRSNARAGVPFVALSCRFSRVSPIANHAARMVGLHSVQCRSHLDMSAQVGSQRLGERGQSASQRRMGPHGAKPSRPAPLPQLRGVGSLLAVTADSFPWFSGLRARIPRRRTPPLPPKPDGDGADRSPPARGALRRACRADCGQEGDARGVTWHTASNSMAGSEVQGSCFVTKRARAASVYKASLLLGRAELLGWWSGHDAVKPSGKPSSRPRRCRGCQSAPR